MFSLVSIKTNPMISSPIYLFQNKTGDCLCLNEYEKYGRKRT